MTKKSDKKKSGKPAKRQSSSRLVPMLSIVSIVIILFAIIGFSKELIRKYQINKDIREIREEIAELEKENEDLSYLVDYLQTDSFKEIQARQNLGLQKGGETTVLVEGDDASASTGKTVTFRDGSSSETPVVREEGVSPVAAEPEPSGSTVKAWWSYFFASNER